MEIKIRKEEKSDYQAVFQLIKNAFISEIESEPDEQNLVERLRNSKSFIPELSLVAELDGKVVGHILLSEIKIINELSSTVSLALAPVSVDPTHQKKGIGGLLIKKAHEISRNLGYKSIVLLGHAKYYPRFGYKLAKEYQISIPFDAPEENCMVVELVENGLDGVSGMVEYPEEFMQ
jgi:predicted N-acetyltransferase YhbS